MKKIFWITALIVLTITLTACGGSKQTAAPSTKQPAESQPQPTSQPPPEATKETGEAPASDDPSAIFHAAMEGVETNVERFFEGIPVPEDASIQTKRDEKVEFITSSNVAEVTQWYRDTFTSLGLVEIEQLAKESEFSTTTYWGGYPNGQAIIVKAKKLSATSSKVTVFFKDL